MDPHCPFCEDETLDEDEAPEDDLAAEILAELSEMRGIVLGFARKLEAAAETEDGRRDLPRLNNAAVKAAKAYRQVAVLQLEITGARPLPQARGPRGAAGGTAKDGDRERSSRWSETDGYPFEHGAYTDYDDYDDTERLRLASAKLNERVGRMTAAMDADFEAAGREDVTRKASAVGRAKLVFGIPHPTLDECLRDIEPAYVKLFFGEENVLPPALGPEPPGALEEWDAWRRQYRLDKAG